MNDASNATAEAILRERLERIVLPDVVSPFALSGAIFAAIGADGRMVRAALGEDARGAPVGVDGIFSLASASKLATGLLILKLVEEGSLELDTSLAEYLPEATAAVDRAVTIRRLLSHTAELPFEVRHDLSAGTDAARNPLVTWASGLQWPGDLARACLETPAVAPPGTAMRYSNVGFGLLGLAAERRTGMQLAELLHKRVFAPLGVRANIGRQTTDATAAAGDVSGPYQADGVLEPYNGEVFRQHGSPWAGIYSDIAGLLALTRAYDERTGFISPSLAANARTDQTGGASGGYVGIDAPLGHGPSHPITWKSCPWGLAIEVQGAKTPHWAPSSLPGSFGQIGSSGCLGWHDPASGVTWAVYGARTTDSGWLLRHGVRLAQSAIAAASA